MKKYFISGTISTFVMAMILTLIEGKQADPALHIFIGYVVGCASVLICEKM